MKKDFSYLAALYLGMGLLLHLLGGGSLLSFSTLLTMFLWPAIVVGWFVKLALAILVIAVILAVLRGRAGNE